MTAHGPAHGPLRWSSRPRVPSRILPKANFWTKCPEKEPSEVQRPRGENDPAFFCFHFPPAVPIQ
jgi:hypothetical protein